ncbi:hypothetical protein HYT26_01415 [Candidatus Pacearchaeota archaeon]|nr:hypothetical protein [Candidatus Pacearchaeota archaeon]
MKALIGLVLIAGGGLIANICAGPGYNIILLLLSIALIIAGLVLVGLEMESLKGRYNPKRM